MAEPLYRQDRQARRELSQARAPDRRGGVVLADHRSAPGTAPAVVQRVLNGTASQPGTNVALPGTASSLGDAAERCAKAISLRARTSAAGVQSASPLGANNAGNLFMSCQYTAGAGVGTLETWNELTDGGGGYVKRVRVTDAAGTVMDRVINEPAATATELQKALAKNVQPSFPGVVLHGNSLMDSVHEVHVADAKELNIDDGTSRAADNLTKLVGEGARFPWLAHRLATGKIGNKSRGVLKMTINIPQAGRFEVDPTFEDLWGAWRAAFDRSYLKDMTAAKVMLGERLRSGWRRPRDGEVAGNAGLESGKAPTGLPSSLLRKDGTLALVPDPPSTANIVSGLKLTWVSDD